VLNQYPSIHILVLAFPGLPHHPVTLVHDVLRAMILSRRAVRQGHSYAVCVSSAEGGCSVLGNQRQRSQPNTSTPRFCIASANMQRPNIMLCIEKQGQSKDRMRSASRNCRKVTGIKSCQLLNQSKKSKENVATSNKTIIYFCVDRLISTVARRCSLPFAM